MELTWPGVLARRLRRHGLAAPLGGSPADVARAMCGAHAQVMAAGEVSVALRLASGSRRRCKPRCGPTTRWSRPSARAAPCTCWPPPTCRCGPGRCRRPHRTRRSPTASGSPDQTEAVLAGIAAALADAELTVDELTEALADTVGAWAVDP